MMKAIKEFNAAYRSEHEFLRGFRAGVTGNRYHGGYDNKKYQQGFDEGRIIFVKLVEAAQKSSNAIAQGREHSERPAGAEG